MRLPDLNAWFGAADGLPRGLWRTAIVLAGALIVVETTILIRQILEAPGSWEFGQDYSFYREIGSRWLRDGSFYTPQQLAGHPYQMAPMADVLYPPLVLPLFVAMVFVPAILWWAIPATVIAYAAFRWRPSIWSVAFALILLAWPRSVGYILYGNSDIWLAAMVAGGLLWGWPAALVVLKPSLLPLALLGATRRSWFVAMLSLAILSIAMLPMWLQYINAMRNIALAWDYSLGSVPLVCVPLALWVGRRRTTWPVSIA